MKNKIEDYLGNLDDLKTKIAKMCIDLTGVIESDYVVLVRVSRKHGVFLEYHKNDIDEDDTHDRFWYDFPIYFYRDLPSGYYVRQTLDGVFYLVDGYEDFVEEIDINDLMNDLIDDLVERNYNEFWNEFLVEFQKWINAEEMD